MTLTPFFISEKIDEEMPCDQKLQGFLICKGEQFLFTRVSVRPRPRVSTHGFATVTTTLQPWGGSIDFGELP